MGDRDGRELLQSGLSMPTLTSDIVAMHFRVRARGQLSSSCAQHALSVRWCRSDADAPRALFTALHSHTYLEGS